MLPHPSWANQAPSTSTHSNQQLRCSLNTKLLNIDGEYLKVWKKNQWLMFFDHQLSHFFFFYMSALVPRAWRQKLKVQVVKCCLISLVTGPHAKPTQCPLIKRVGDFISQDMSRYIRLLEASTQGIAEKTSESCIRNLGQRPNVRTNIFLGNHIYVCVMMIEYLRLDKL